MNTASLELSKELYELSDWIEEWKEGDPPYLYSLGFLLRKLPAVRLRKGTDGEYTAELYVDDVLLDFNDKEPENCLCKLAIELFKQGVLKK
jgi:hypothetical protein